MTTWNGRTLIRRLVATQWQIKMSRYWKKITMPHLLGDSSVVLANIHRCEIFSICPNCCLLLVLTNEFWKALRHTGLQSKFAQFCVSTNPAWSKWRRGTCAGAGGASLFPSLHSFFLISLPQTILTVQKMKLNFRALWAVICSSLCRMITWEV